MIEDQAVPKDHEQYWNSLNLDQVTRYLKQEGAYTFSFSLIDDDGDIRTRNMTVSPTDLRLGRVCLSKTDITESTREQQCLLRVITYTCELAGSIDVSTGSLSMYTRQMALENLPPHTAPDYNGVLDSLVGCYEVVTGRKAIKRQFCLETLMNQPEEKLEGYNLVLLYQRKNGLRYRRVNVLWGDQNHRTICLMRSDVMEMLAAERASKIELEWTLSPSREASRAKGDFLSAVSHDIRTPVNAIMGVTALANANIDDPDRMQSCLQKIATSSKHLLSLINDVLDMSRIEQAKIRLNQERIYLPKLAGQVSGIIKTQADGTGLRCDIRTGRMRTPCFYRDALCISQILINILGNVVKFTPTGGTIGLSMEELSFAEGKYQACYHFTVSDTGTEMSSEIQAQPFGPLTRSNAVSRVEGSGLGLSIVKRLVDLMSGAISVQSELGKGSVFTVELESEAAPAPEDEGVETEKLEEPVGRPFTGCRFLATGNNEPNAEILCEVLRMYGTWSEVKGNGIQVVGTSPAVALGAYDTILMDIQMPEMNGYEVTRAVRSADRIDVGTTPIIAMIANAFEEDIRVAVEAGAGAHIAKPVDTEVLKTTLDKTLAGSRGRNMM